VSFIISYVSWITNRYKNVLDINTLKAMSLDIFKRQVDPLKAFLDII